MIFSKEAIDKQAMAARNAEIDRGERDSEIRATVKKHVRDMLKKDLDMYQNQSRRHDILYQMSNAFARRYSELRVELLTQLLTAGAGLLNEPTDYQAGDIYHSPSERLNCVALAVHATLIHVAFVSTTKENETPVNGCFVRSELNDRLAEGWNRIR